MVEIHQTLLRRLHGPFARARIDGKEGELKPCRKTKIHCVKRAGCNRRGTSTSTAQPARSCGMLLRIRARRRFRLRPMLNPWPPGAPGSDMSVTSNKPLPNNSHMKRRSKMGVAIAERRRAADRPWAPGMVRNVTHPSLVKAAPQPPAILS